MSILAWTLRIVQLVSFILNPVFALHMDLRRRLFWRWLRRVQLEDAVAELGYTVL